ncbi:polyprenyl synthetase family protein [Staphylospora marina]|uniref:polyprenyl synthetase family protein n=1 Tax=Staphylospora marina TaxID=2490858 RepID=UPI000F5BEE1C|nr:polyprenyl synthetase family protein [Staphylospora marina]
MNLQDIYLNLKKDLEIVEQALARSVEADVAVLRDASLHLLKSGGKRMRPVFVLLSGHFGRYEVERLCRAAVALEMIHMATLVHDDVIDDADTRRGRKTVKAEWDNRVAMYAGDWLFARALRELADLGDHRVQVILAEAMRLMCLGEIEQIEDLYAERLSLRRYLRRIKRKTALLMSISCHLGALVAGASEEHIRLLRAYGYYVGMAFQLTDDVLDLTGDERILGKPAGSDLKQGNVTLPVLHVLHTGTADHRQKILDFLRSQGMADNLGEVLDIVRGGGGVEATLELSRRYLNKAIDCLNRLPDSHQRESLRLIAEFIVRRNY